jgi:hypothetical protein
VAAGQGPENAPVPLDLRIVQAMRLIDAARDLLWQVAQASPMTGTATDRVGMALRGAGTASLSELVSMTGLHRESVSTALVRLGEKAHRIGRGVYAWSPDADPILSEEEGAQEAAAPPPPPPQPSPRMLAKMARAAAEDEIRERLGIADRPVNTKPMILRPLVETDDTEPEEKLRRGEQPEPKTGRVSPTNSADSADVDTSVEIIAWDPAWGPKPERPTSKPE